MSSDYKTLDTECMKKYTVLSVMAGKPF